MSAQPDFDDDPIEGFEVPAPQTRRSRSKRRTKAVEADSTTPTSTKPLGWCLLVEDNTHDKCPGVSGLGRVCTCKCHDKGEQA